MRPEHFDAFCQRLKDTLLELIHEQHAKHGHIGVTDPRFNVLKYDAESNTVAPLLDPQLLATLAGVVPPQHIAESIRATMQRCKEFAPDVYAQSAVVVLSLGTARSLTHDDPDELEAIAHKVTRGDVSREKMYEMAGESYDEVLVLHIEDGDRNVASYFWVVETVDGKLQLTAKVDPMIAHDYDYALAGAMQNLYGHPPRAAQTAHHQRVLH